LCGNELCHQRDPTHLNCFKKSVILISQSLDWLFLSNLLLSVGIFMSKPLSIPSELLNRAAMGNPAAQFELAEIYMQSEDEDNNQLAEEWALKAAQLGHVEAMYWLGEGYAYYAKDILEEDPKEAKAYFEHAHRWLEQAVKHQHPAAILELSNFYRRGDVVEKDLVKSVELVEQAAKLGEVQAMRDLVCIYEHGMGVDVDEEKADFWAEKAKSAEDTSV